MYMGCMPWVSECQCTNGPHMLFCSSKIVNSSSKYPGIVGVTLDATIIMLVYIPEEMPWGVERHVTHATPSCCSAEEGTRQQTESVSLHPPRPGTLWVLE